MEAINFLKYDLRRSRYIFLLSIVFFAPLGAMMGRSMGSLLGVFSYMGLVVVIAPTSLFTYEQKTDCGFDGLLPAKDRDRVLGRYMLGGLCIIFQLLLAIISGIIMSTFTNLKLPGLAVTCMTFIAVTLMYLSIAFIIYYLIGRNLNQQIRGIMVMVPGFVVWGVINAFIGLFKDGDVMEIALKIVENKEIISALALVIGVAMYVISSLISTQIVKKKDFR